jgi:hypothetical protein
MAGVVVGVLIALVVLKNVGMLDVVSVVWVVTAWARLRRLKLTAGVEAAALVVAALATLSVKWMAGIASVSRSFFLLEVFLWG